MSPKDVVQLGQVFTPDCVVDLMLGLRRNRGRVLEPSAGNGAFSTRLPGVFAAGDIVRGASLVVWAVREGRDVAQSMHAWLKARAGTAATKSAAIEEVA